MSTPEVVLAWIHRTYPNLDCYNRGDLTFFEVPNCYALHNHLVISHFSEYSYVPSLDGDGVELFHSDPEYFNKLKMLLNTALRKSK